jgi:hypothetical protein
VKLAADECCDALLVAGLRRDGHDVWYATESARGTDDEKILRQVSSEHSESTTCSNAIGCVPLGSAPSKIASSRAAPFPPVGSGRWKKGAVE